MRACNQLQSPFQRNWINWYPKTNVLCEPQLSKRNLYPTISQKEFHEKDTKLRMDVLAYANGKNSIFDIAIKLNKKLKAINEEIKLLKKANLIS